MAVRRFRTKLLVLVIVALVALQTATLIAVHVAGQRTLRKRIDEELHVGARVLDRVLRTRARQLADTVRVLASDFAFKEAIASGDRPTIDSALHNHGERIAADAVFLIAPDGTVTSDSLASTRTGKPFAFPSLLRTAEENNEASATVSIAGRPYQLVITPVLAPQPIAWVCMGFAIDERVVNDIRRLTSLEVSLWSTATGANPQLVTTLPAPLRDSLVSQMRTLPATRTITETTLPLRDANYATLLEPLQTTDGSKVNMLVQLSFDEARKPFANLELQIFTFTSLALLAAVVAAIIFARAVTRPLRSLADGAERIERGDYVSPIVINQHDEIGHLATSFNNMQQAIALREEQIIYQATHDGLTGLPNRTLFMDRLAQGIAASKRTGDAVGMIMMDLDRFKEINDTLGHHFGDQLLIEIGRRLAATLREGDTVARLGGDEFAVRFMAREPSHGIRVAKRITEALEKPFVLGEVAIDINASIGIATFPTHADDAESLMKRADIAMYEAKKNHERIAVYEAGRDEHSLRRLSLMMELRHAVANNQLDLHYQPKIDVATERVVHAEALARWHHPVHGMMRPDEFIPLAEQTGNIGLITKWVLRRAIHQCATWLREGHDLAVAVNLSALDSSTPSSPPTSARCCRRPDFPRRTSFSRSPRAP